MQANPVPERQLESLQRLLGDLCARGRTEVLVRLPFAGTLTVARNGAPPQLLSLADEALQFLKRHAETAELAARPQPYQVKLQRCLYNVIISQATLLAD